MRIGVPKEIKTDEYRVALTPWGAAELIRLGHSVCVEAGAGEGSGFADGEYRRVGARIATGAAEVWGEADLVLKVKEPIVSEYPLLREGLILFTYLHLAADRRLTEELCAKKVTAYAYETLRIGGRLPLLEPMSEIAGRMATLFGATRLGRYYGGSGRLLGGAVGCEPGRVVVLGAGNAGKAAAEAAAALGAGVVVLDIDRERLAYLRDVMSPRITFLLSSAQAISDNIKEADLIIGTVLVPGAKAPKLISREMLGLMKRGTVLVDVSIDQGGCFETSRPTTHSDPTFEVEGIIHYCVANMPGMYPRTSTVALSAATLPHVIAIASTPESDLLRDPPYRSALNTRAGNVTNEAVAKAHGFASKF